MRHIEQIQRWCYEDIRQLLIHTYTGHKQLRLKHQTMEEGAALIRRRSKSHE